MCWDLLLSQVTPLQCHDDHLHWHSGEQSPRNSVMNSRVLMNNYDHVLYICIIYIISMHNYVYMCTVKCTHGMKCTSHVGAWSNRLLCIHTCTCMYICYHVYNIASTVILWLVVLDLLVVRVEYEWCGEEGRHPGPLRVSQSSKFQYNTPAAVLVSPTW